MFLTCLIRSLLESRDSHIHAATAKSHDQVYRVFRMSERAEVASDWLLCVMVITKLQYQRYCRVVLFCLDLKIIKRRI